MAYELLKGKGDVAPAIDIAADIERFAELGVLGTLLADRSTGGNIIWASSVFSDKGESYAPEDEIFVGDITGENAGIIRTRASKNRDDQVALTRAHAEVFTPVWVVRKMVDWADEAWYESHDFGNRTWQAYVKSPRLEITCGEAPYLVSRYDAADGTRVPVYRRCGVLDRKLMKVVKHTTTRRSWWQWVLWALKNTYGYEYQGDNLLIARVNVLATLEDFCDTSGWEPFSEDEYRTLAEIISWNFWQMDGLTDCVPNGALGNESFDMRLPDFEDQGGTNKDGQYAMGITRGRSTAKIYDWEHRHEVEFQALKREVTLMDNGPRIRFDYIIGNPPYQEEQEGDNKTYAPPIYHLFMDESFKIADSVELIHPARFLFDAGSTPKAWNRKMLGDPHFKVLYYEADSSKVFPTTDIKGGIAITYRDERQDYGAIEHFIIYDELNSIVAKVGEQHERSINTIILAAETYKFTEALHDDLPNAASSLSKGHRYDLKTSVFTSLEESAFFKEKPDDGEYVRIIGLIKGQRCYRWIRREYIQGPINFNRFKVLVPAANGSGALGEVLSAPMVAPPFVGHTQTFISIGNFDNQNDAEACLKYIKTRFARLLLGVLKITQHNPGPKWKYVPIQDFTPESDIDWSQPIADIDRQLYAKYGLTQEEVDFIETHVKEMQ